MENCVAVVENPRISLSARHRVRMSEMLVVSGRLHEVMGEADAGAGHISMILIMVRRAVGLKTLSLWPIFH